MEESGRRDSGSNPALRAQNAPPGSGGLTRVQRISRLRTTKALAAVEALVASTIADRDVAAVRAGRSILLEVRDGVAQGLHLPLGLRGGNGRVAVAIAAVAGRCIKKVGVFCNGQLRHRPVDLLLLRFLQPGDG